MSLAADIADIVARSKTFEKTAAHEAKQLSSSPTIGTLRKVGALLQETEEASNITIAYEDVARILGK